MNHIYIINHIECRRSARRPFTATDPSFEGPAGDGLDRGSMYFKCAENGVDKLLHLYIHLGQ